eukprot:Skav207815  [mRNA]  locus=scaffold381:447692:448660:+ [translate_table: standard]
MYSRVESKPASALAEASLALICNFASSACTGATMNHFGCCFNNSLRTARTKGGCPDEPMANHTKGCCSEVARSRNSPTSMGTSCFSFPYKGPT